MNLKKQTALTMHKHKTTNDAHGFVRSFFGQVYNFDIYQAKSKAVQCLCSPIPEPVIKTSSFMRQYLLLKRTLSHYMKEFFGSVGPGTQATLAERPDVNCYAD
jgi:hypothetical protein